MTTNKTAKTKVTFEETLKKIIETSSPVPTSALYAFSAIDPDQQAQFEEAWPEIPLERRQKITGSLYDLAEEVIELSFESIFTFLLKDPDEKVRAKAVDGLSEDESRPVLIEFIRLLETDPSPFVQEKVAAGLSHFAYLAEVGGLTPRWVERIRETLFAHLANEETPVEIKRRLVEAVGYFSHNDKVTRLIEKAYQSEDELLVAGALRAMGRNMNTRWLPEIGKELSSKEPLLRFEAATAVGEMSSSELMPSLLKLLKDPDREVRLAVIWSLGQLGGSEAKRILKELAGHENSLISEAAQEALGEIDDSDNPLNPLSGGF